MPGLKTLLAITLVLGVSQTAFSTNYCDKSLCRPNQKHIGCNNNGKFSKQCSSDAKIMPITPKLRDLIVQKHNKLRNKFASGYSKFPAAARMGTMQWNNELAALAELNAKRCDFEHDDCLNTPTFRSAGQNLALESVNDESVDEIVKSEILDWFSEHNETSVANMQSFPRDDKTSDKIGHFTVMVRENAVHVGCAILRQFNEEDDIVEQTMTCNYGSTNIISKPVYTTGTAASQCKTGTNPSFNKLCSIKEVYKF